MCERKITNRSISNDTLIQIFQELPVKSLLRFKCVSKEWCLIIEDPQFVDAHRIHSHSRSGGISLLGQRLVVNEPIREQVIFLLDPELNSEPIHIQTPPIFYSRSRATQPTSRHIEGLVCLGNYIWNPSTRKGIKLSDQQEGGRIPYFLGYGEYRIRNEYILGFDAPSKIYKVLSICNISAYPNFEIRTEAQVLTLGTKLWRNLECIPEQFKQGGRVDASCCIDSVIFSLICFLGSDTSTRQCPRNAVLSFEVRNEKFLVISLPVGLEMQCFAFEVNGQFAIMDQTSATTIWILQDYKNEKWINMNISFPQDWVVSQVPSTNRSAIGVTPIGTIHTREILFEARNHCARSEIFYFYYDLETGNVRQIPRSFGSFIKFSKHVETVFPFK